MTPTTAPAADALIDEVRERRRDLMASLGNDLRELGKAIRARQCADPEGLVDLRGDSPTQAAGSDG